MAWIDTEVLILVGDSQQLSPNPLRLLAGRGLSAELEQSALRYFLSNHHRSATLFMQRRGMPGMMDVVSQMFYHNTIVDSAITSSESNPCIPSHAKAVALIGQLFPNFEVKKPYLFIEAIGLPEIKDEITDSFLNLSSASVCIHIVEKLVTEHNFDPTSIKIVTHYSAQKRILEYALHQLSLKHADHRNFELVTVHTTDSFQGGAGDIVVSDSVRTATPGFTNISGRNAVLHSRGRAFYFCVGNPGGLQAHKEPLMRTAFDIAKRRRACLRISTGMEEYAYLMEHDFVAARVRGTSANVSQIQGQQAQDPPYADPEVDAEEPTVPEPTNGQGGWGPEQQQTNDSDETRVVEIDASGNAGTEALEVRDIWLPEGGECSTQVGGDW